MYVYIMYIFDIKKFLFVKHEYHIYSGYLGYKTSQETSYS